LRFSLITVAYNAAPYIRTAIESVLAQDHPHIDYLVVDGGSTDGTQDIVRSYGKRVKLLAEPDEGLYDAMNKGIARAQGDVIGLLNADDLYASDQVISQVAAAFAGSGSDTVFGDLVYVREEDLLQVVRYFPGRGFQPRRWLRRGMMPPHPTFFVRRHLYEKAGAFDLQYRIAADFDLMVRFFLKHQVSYTYLPEVLVRMRTGGSSTAGLASNLQINREMLRSLRSHGIPSNLPLIYSKYLTKVFQLLRRPEG